MNTTKEILMKLYFLVMTTLIELKPGQLTNSLANDDNKLKFKKFDTEYG
jgi:hypothetical protein